MRSGEGFNPLRSFQSQADERTPLPLGLGDDRHGWSVFQDHGVSANVNEHGGGWSACAWRCRGAGGSGSGAGGAAAARALSARPGEHGGAAVCPRLAEEPAAVQRGCRKVAAGPGGPGCGGAGGTPISFPLSMAAEPAQTQCAVCSIP